MWSYNNIFQHEVYNFAGRKRNDKWNCTKLITKHINSVSPIHDEIKIRLTVSSTVVFLIKRKYLRSLPNKMNAVRDNQTLSLILGIKSLNGNPPWTNGTRKSVNSWDADRDGKRNQIFQSQLSDFFQLIFINKHPLEVFRLFRSRGVG